MPTPKAKRDIVLQSTFASTDTVATLSLGIDAEFTTSRGTSTVNLFQDSSVAGENEDTAYQMTFGPSAGQIGVLTMTFTGNDNPAMKDVTVAKTSATTSIDPAATTTTVTPISSPDASYTRTWQQMALDAGLSEVVNQVGGVDIRVKAGSSYRVTQTVTSTAVAQLVLSYSFKSASGAEVMSGTVTFTASSVAGTGYSLGTATVSDGATPRGARHR
jgi:hypothetical protein